MKQKRKLIGIPLLAVLLALSACTGGGGTGGTNEPSNPADPAQEGQPYFNPTGFPISNQPIVLNTMIQTSPGQAPWNDLWISKHLGEILGGTINATEIQSWQEQKNLAFSTGELPDMFVTLGALTGLDVANYSAQGLLLPLNDLIDQYAPNIKALLDENPDVVKSLTMPDGNIYALPGFLDSPRELVVGRYWINKQWLENLNLDIPTTLDEFYTVLKAFKEQDPNGNGLADEIPASGDLGNPIKMIVLTALGLTQDKIGLDMSGTKVVYAPTTPEYREYLEFMNRLYAEGLLDSEYFSQNVQSFRGKAAQGQVGFFFDAAHFVAAGLQNYEQYGSFPPLTSDINDTQIWPVKRYNTSGGLYSMAITSKNQYPEATIRLFDYMVSEEGGFLVRIGPDVGVVHDEHGVQWNDDGTFQLKVPEGVSGLDWRKANVTNTSLNYSLTKDAQEVSPPEQISLTENLIENQLPYGKPIYPDVVMTKEEQDRVATLAADLDAYVTQMEARFIVGDTPFDQYDTYLDTLRNIGVDTFVEVYQAAFDRWNQQ